MTPGRILRRVRAELRLSGLAAWRGLVELVNSNDLTHAAAIAYYALLSFFPFLLLVISLLGSVTADENPVVNAEGVPPGFALLGSVMQDNVSRAMCI